MTAAIGAPLAAACSSTARNDFRLPDSLCLTPAPVATAQEEASAAVRIIAAAGSLSMGALGSATTAVWSYFGGMVRGGGTGFSGAIDPTTESPIIRAQQGELLPVLVDNRLPVETTVHWHGLRLHNTMDGVPQVTQGPIAAGNRHLYKLLCRDAGTYWYHPHLNSQEQIVRGLGAALIVAENNPYPVDQDLLWVLKDWLLDSDQQIRADFDDTRDMTHAGRIGNRVTINSQPAMFADRDPVPLLLPAGSRVRLRLINASSARNFVLRFESDAPFAPMVAAFDGFPCPLHPMVNNELTIAAAQRVDLIFDMGQQRLKLRDLRDPRRPFVLREIHGELATAAGRARRTAIEPLPANRWTNPDLNKARELPVVFEGGNRGQLKSARLGKQTLSAQELLDRQNMNWAINGVASRDHDPEPMLCVRCGDTVVLRMRNETQWQHPIHLHGFHFQVLTIDGKAPAIRLIRDTFMMEPRSSADIAFVADNPGTWMFHCHILQHQAGGMMAVIQVD